MRLPHILKEIGQVADECNTRIFVVGGFVRDLLLGVQDVDIDIVVEADAINFAKILADRFGVKFIKHEGFKTATLEKNGFRIDLATARKEYYKKPAVLPTVKPGTIKEDLFRRDFTINAMAISLNKGSFGELVDFFGGLADLKNKKIRVLHEKSFIDDPTRILRLLRFKHRLGFKVERRTQELMRKAIESGIFQKLKKQRIKKEIELILKEPGPSDIFRETARLGIELI